MSLAKVDKPPYEIPSLEEIREYPWNGYKVVSTFTGAGGSCLGFKMAGFKAIYANEFIPAARETYKKNFPGVLVDDRDIRDVSAKDILEATRLTVGQVDVLEGSPPCASFSMAGKREKSWSKVKQYSDTKQRTDDLFFEFARLVDGIRPKVFVAENVAGLVRGKAKGYFKEILRALKQCGYLVQARVLDAQWLGVPQARRRVIFIGVRDDLVEEYGVEPRFPTPWPYRYTLRDALSHIIRHGDNGGFGKGGFVDSATKPSGTIGASPNTGNGKYLPSLVEVVGVGTFNSEKSLDEPAPTVLSHGRRSTRNELTVVEQVKRVTGRTGPSFQRIESELDQPMNAIQATDPDQTRYEVDITRYAIGKEWNNLKPGEQSSKYFNLVKPSLTSPCPTITQKGGDVTAASVTHPTERRKFTIEELKRICSFPRDFVLTGTYAQQWERLGRSVPPLMMRAIAEVVRDEILEKIHD